MHFKQVGGFLFLFFSVSKVAGYVVCPFPNIVTKSFGILFGKIALIIHTFRYLYQICLELVKIMHFHTFLLFKTIEVNLVATHNLMICRHPLILKC